MAIRVAANPHCRAHRRHCQDLTSSRYSTRNLPSEGDARSHPGGHSRDASGRSSMWITGQVCDDRASGPFAHSGFSTLERKTDALTACVATVNARLQGQRPTVRVSHRTSRRQSSPPRSQKAAPQLQAQQPIAATQPRVAGSIAGASVTTSVQPVISRETRRLLITMLLAVAALWVLARIRFQERPVTSTPVPNVLAQLRPTSSYEDLARLIAEIRPVITAAVSASRRRPRAPHKQRCRRDVVTWSGRHAADVGSGDRPRDCSA